MKAGSALVLAAAGLLAACGNGAVARQAPAVISGTVTATPACLAGVACSKLVTVVPHALVQARGKSGTQLVHADSRGRYSISLLEGLYYLQAARAPSAPGPGGVEVSVRPNERRTVNLRISG